MFFNLSTILGNDTLALTEHPERLSQYLDQAWASAAVAPNRPLLLGDGALGAAGIIGLLARPAPPATFAVAPGLLWNHLLYAYLIENTGIFEVVREVVRRFSSGEFLDAAGADVQRWARTTEELFFRDPPHFFTASAWSDLRSDPRVSRRNAYWRMFGMDLGHPVRDVRGDPSPPVWKDGTAGAANTVFRERWSELLRQVWLGIENSRNTSGANATDAAYIGLICTSLADLLGMRRRDGLLAREEFAAVAAASWMHLLVRQNNNVITGLNCNASTPADRLGLLAGRVGMRPSPAARELFDMATPASTVLRTIETRALNAPAAARALYDPTVPGSAPLRSAINTIIDLWQSATGERVKDRAVAVTQGAASAQPLRVPGSQPLAPSPVAPALNGARR
jgi:hypothetical protein